jgi:hypothetical protein
MNEIQYIFLAIAAILPAVVYFNDYPYGELFFMSLFTFTVTYIVMYYIEPIFYYGSEKECLTEE